MAFQGLTLGGSGHGLNTSWFIFSAYFLNTDTIEAVANIEQDNCDLDKIEWDAKNKLSFLVHLKNITRKHISDKVNYQFHLIYTTTEGKAYQQTVKYNGEGNINSPQEITIKNDHLKIG